jgi:hypothetical protein
VRGDRVQHDVIDWDNPPARPGLERDSTLFCICSTMTRRRARHIHEAHQVGRLDAFAVMRAMDSVDEGDTGRVSLLERRAASLGAQIADVMAAISPPERRAPDPLEAAASRAHAAFAEVTRARLAEAETGRTEPPPFRPRLTWRRAQH